MAQQVRALTTKLDNLSLIFRTDINVEGRNESHKLSSNLHMSAVTPEHPHMYTHTEQINVKQFE